MKQLLFSVLGVLALVFTLYAFKGSTPAPQDSSLEDCGCYHAGSKYSRGSYACMEGTKYRCDAEWDGQKREWTECHWDNTYVDCE